VVDAAGLSEKPVHIHWTAMYHFPNCSLIVTTVRMSNLTKQTLISKKSTGIPG